MGDFNIDMLKSESCTHASRFTMKSGRFECEIVMVYIVLKCQAHGFVLAIFHIFKRFAPVIQVHIHI